MATTGQFSARSPTIKRIMKEANELASQPSNDYQAAPLGSDLFEWHFTIRGPPKPSPFAEGAYHGRIVLPPAYPLKPPSFRFLTPTGRFEPNREICLSISGHHEETWQPAWGIRTALVALRSFMDTDARGQIGGMDASEGLRRRLASQSIAWRCPACGKSNGEIMKAQDESVKETGREDVQKELLPPELRLAYRDDLAKAEESEAGVHEAVKNTADQAPTPPIPTNPHVASSANTTTSGETGIAQPQQRTRPAVGATAQQQQTREFARQGEGIPPWIEKAIWIVVAAIAYMMLQRVL